MNADELVRVAHHETKGTAMILVKPTEAELWLAALALSIVPGTSRGFMRAIPPAVRPMDIKGRKAIDDDPTLTEGERK